MKVADHELYEAWLDEPCPGVKLPWGDTGLILQPPEWYAPGDQTPRSRRGAARRPSSECCDCGLVHIVLLTPARGSGCITLRAWRDRRRTAASRRLRR